jgi:hypothetical protein
MPALISGVFTLRNIAIDIVILAGIYFVPALAHVAPFQLYMLDPMRVFMLAGYLLTRQNANAYLLALTIPLFSALITGHPPLFKAVLISIELVVNLLLFTKLLSRTRMHLAIALFLSIAGSKLVYYVIKFVFINLGLVEGGLITTGLWLQLLTSVFVTLVFSLIWKKTGMERPKTA